ncbi:MAG: hypothetical protein PHR77_05360 [Kiritimatiellae bacterium]|nr:hypothetical protein [Kiritimatiellia bacterium]MDD5521502.1 hypothetical protein [Kiritimatiellia bacterium]
MTGEDAVLVPAENEIAAGFSVQTLSYPDRYELPRLASSKKNRLERAVALEIDVNNRIKRCKASDGYVHELFIDGEWCEHQKFLSMDDVIRSDIYKVFCRKEGLESLEMEDRD